MRVLVSDDGKEYVAKIEVGGETVEGRAGVNAYPEDAVNDALLKLTGENMDWTVKY